MDISAYFNGYVFDEEKLKEYGFTGGKFTKSCGDDFTIHIYKEDRIVTLTIIDNSFDDEIVSYETPLFKSAYEELIEDIKVKCCIKVNFLTAQANFIDSFISGKYGVKAEFLWDKYVGYGIYRNPRNKKWFGIIMNIDYSIIDKNKKGMVEIINIKLGNVNDLLQKDGYYPAYHMNKKYWITIVLDDTLDNETIMTLADASYANVDK